MTEKKLQISQYIVILTTVWPSEFFCPKIRALIFVPINMSMWKLGWHELKINKRVLLLLRSQIKLYLINKVQVLLLLSIILMRMTKYCNYRRLTLFLPIYYKLLVRSTTCICWHRESTLKSVWKQLWNTKKNNFVVYVRGKTRNKWTTMKMDF